MTAAVDDLPVNPIARVTRDHYIIDPCAVCGGTHRHGAVPELEVGETARRSAHCRDQGGEYRLKMVESTKVATV